MTSILNPSASAVTTQQSLLSAMSHTKQAAPKVDKAEAKRLGDAARQFEAVFLRQMLSCLEKTASMQGGKDAGSNLYGSMMVDAVADAVSRAGGIGLGAMLTKSLEPQLGAPNAVPSAAPMQTNVVDSSTKTAIDAAGLGRGGHP